MSTPKKRRLDPIDSSTGSHQHEGNSRFIDLIDPKSDYLPNQLRFFLNQLRLRWRQCHILDSHDIRTPVDLLKSKHAPDWLRVTFGQLWSFKLVEDASNWLRARSNYHLVLKDGSHNQSEQDVKDFSWRKLSYPPTRYHHIQDKNWSHRMIFLYWTHH
jgi:hypothetical protein